MANWPCCLPFHSHIPTVTVGMACRKGRWACPRGADLHAIHSRRSGVEKGTPLVQKRPRSGKRYRNVLGPTGCSRKDEVIDNHLLSLQLPSSAGDTGWRRKRGGVFLLKSQFENGSVLAGKWSLYLTVRNYRHRFHLPAIIRPGEASCFRRLEREKWMGKRWHLTTERKVTDNVPAWLIPVMESKWILTPSPFLTPSVGIAIVQQVQRVLTTPQQATEFHCLLSNCARLRFCPSLKTDEDDVRMMWTLGSFWKCNHNKIIVVICTNGQGNTLLTEHCIGDWKS